MPTLTIETDRQGYILSYWVDDPKLAKEVDIYDNYIIEEEIAVRIHSSTGSRLMDILKWVEKTHVPMK